MAEEHPPIHSAKGVEYWDENLKEYILDPTPDMHEYPPADIKKGWRPEEITVIMNPRYAE